MLANSLSPVDEQGEQKAPSMPLAIEGTHGPGPNEPDLRWTGHLLSFLGTFDQWT